MERRDSRVILNRLYLGFFLFGLIANLMFLSSAKREQQSFGYRPAGLGCLVLLLWIHLILPIVVLPAIVIVPPILRLRAEARKKRCRSHLEQIRRAMLAYTGHSRQYPPSLADLYPKFICNPAIFVSPLDSRPERIRKGLTSSYHYVGTSPDWKESPHVVWAYTRWGLHKGGRNVLYYDGEIRWERGRLLQLLECERKDFWQKVLRDTPSRVDRRRLDAFLRGVFYEETHD